MLVLMVQQHQHWPGAADVVPQPVGQAGVQHQQNQANVKLGPV